MASKGRAKPPISPPNQPKYQGRNRYTYVINAELKTDKDVFVRREKWRDSHFHVAARDSKGHFIATKRWSKFTTKHTFESKYKNPTRTLTIESKKKYNMESKRNQNMMFNKVQRKYGRYNFRSETFTYRFIYDSNTGERI